MSHTTSIRRSASLLGATGLIALSMAGPAGAREVPGNGDWAEQHCSVSCYEGGTPAGTSTQTFRVDDNAIEVLHGHPDWLWQIARLLAQRVNATTAMLTRDASGEDALILPQHFMSSWGDPTV